MRSVVDYYYLGDGVFDVLSSEDVINHAWSVARQSFQGARDIHSITGRMVNGLLHESMVQASLDNLTVILITFNNFDSFVRSGNTPTKPSGNSEVARRG